MLGPMLDLRCDISLDNLKDSGDDFHWDERHSKVQKKDTSAPKNSELETLQELFDRLTDCQADAASKGDKKGTQKLLDVRNVVTFKMCKIKDDMVKEKEEE